MRSYDPWDACVTMAKFWGNLKWVAAVLMERLLGRGSSSLANCHLRRGGGGVRGSLPSFLASELERPQKGEK